jgi:hypothetical protein
MMDKKENQEPRKRTGFKRNDEGKAQDNKDFTAGSLKFA